jgi:hypothetical protein
VRVAFGLPAVTSYAQITRNATVQSELIATYGTVASGGLNRIDPFEGMLAEDHVNGGNAGATMKAIVTNQFARLRDGDRFFYLNENFTPEEANIIAQGNTLGKIITNNTGITNLQSNVFSMTLEFSGAVFNDLNGDGIRQPGEPGLAGVTVNLNDATGHFIVSTTTDANGEYDFTDKTGIPGTGNFTLSVVLPAGFTQNATEIAHNPRTIHLSRGDLAFDGQNFALRHSAGAPGGEGGGSSGSLGIALQQIQGTTGTDQTLPQHLVTSNVAPVPLSNDLAASSTVEVQTPDQGTSVQSVATLQTDSTPTASSLDDSASASALAMDNFFTQM